MANGYAILPDFCLNAATNQTLLLRDRYGLHSPREAYLDDEKIYSVRSHSLTSLVPHFELLDASKKKNTCLAYAKSVASNWHEDAWSSTRTSWEWNVTLGGKAGQPCATIHVTAVKGCGGSYAAEVGFFKDFGESNLRIEAASSQTDVLHVLQNGEREVATLNQTKNNLTKRTYEMCVQQGAPLWAILLLSSALDYILNVDPIPKRQDELSHLLYYYVLDLAREIGL
ncbi:hypothetical protein QOT17_002580 [Balamuthia mandrillaris]